MNCLNGSTPRSSANSALILFSEKGLYASLWTLSSTGDMTKKVRNSDSPTRIWFGGDDCVPMAVRSSPSTIRMRVKLVIDSSSAGKKDSDVIITSICTLSDQVCAPPGPGVLVMPGKPWADPIDGNSHNAASTSMNSGQARRPAKRTDEAVTISRVSAWSAWTSNPPVFAKKRLRLQNC